MTGEGAGGWTMGYCHQCQGLVSLAGDGFIHLDGTPLCKRGSAMTDDNPFDVARAAYTAGYQRGLDAARETFERTHLPIPVIQCACGWGVNCPECGPESNRTVGYVCRKCCDDWGDHGYCSDMHYPDDTPFHHVGGMWSGPYCPVIAAIDAIAGDQP